MNEYFVCHLKDGTVLNFKSSCRFIDYETIEDKVIVIFKDDKTDIPILAMVPIENIMYIESYFGEEDENV